MTEIIIDRKQVRTLFMEVAHEIEPKLIPSHEKAVEKVLKSFLDTPAMAMPRRDIIYLHGKIPEDYLPLVLTHENLHIVIQRICGFNPKESWNTPEVHNDRVVDNPVFNMLLCLSFDIKPLKFVKWLHLNVTKSFLARLLFRVMYFATKSTYEYFIDLAQKMWGE